MRKSSLIGALAGLMAPMCGAVAAPAYTPEEVVAFFAATADLGEARGLCIGTEAECQSSEPQAAGFDMLVSFDLNSAVLTEEARDNLEQLAVALKDERLTPAKFVVEGHSDALGDETYNLTLSEMRAKSVVDFLLERGVEAEKLRVMGLGESNPRTSDPYDAANRRVEMKIRLQ